MTGPIITGSSDTICDNLSIARVTDIVIGFCGHIGVLVSGSPTVTLDNLEVIRVGDPFTGCFTGVIMTGSDTSNIDGE